MDLDCPDTDPEPFGRSDEVTKPRCYTCGRSPFAYDDGFEAGIAYALTQTQGLLASGAAKQRLSAGQAALLVAWLRQHIQPQQQKTHWRSPKF